MLELMAKKGEKPCNTIDTLLGAKAELKGDIVFSGGLRVDGKIRGNITAKGEGNSVLVVSEHATIVGNINVPHVVVNGRVEGNIRAAERLELQAKADITGDISYRSIQMSLGAAVNGSLVREEPDKAALPKLKAVSIAEEASPNHA